MYHHIPALPVLPERCMYFELSRSGFMCITRLHAGTSTPRAATSVATSISNLWFLNSDITSTRLDSGTWSVELSFESFELIVSDYIPTYYNHLKVTNDRNFKSYLNQIWRLSFNWFFLPQSWCILLSNQSFERVLWPYYNRLCVWQTTWYRLSVRSSAPISDTSWRCQLRTTLLCVGCVQGQIQPEINSIQTKVPKEKISKRLHYIQVKKCALKS